MIQVFHHPKTYRNDGAIRPFLAQYCLFWRDIAVYGAILSFLALGCLCWRDSFINGVIPPKTENDTTCIFSLKDIKSDAFATIQTETRSPMDWISMSQNLSRQ